MIVNDSKGSQLPGLPPPYLTAQGQTQPPNTAPILLQTGQKYPPGPTGYPTTIPVTPVGLQPIQGINNAAAIGAQYQSALLARCAQGDHEITTSFGPCGIITAICLFPIGLLCLFLDTQKKCSRCGINLP